MKNLVLVFAMLFATMFTAQVNQQDGVAVESGLTRAQVATQEGNYTIGLNTSGLGFSTVKDGLTTFNAGATFGAFAAQNFAIVGQVGYGSLHYGDTNVNDWTYGAGVKYYMGSRVPLQVDWKGSTGSTVQPSASFVGTQLGYAMFPARNLSVEPTLRYDWSMNRDNYKDVFSGGVSVNVFF